MAPLELDALAGVLARHPLEVLDEGVLPVADVRVVLDVPVPDVALDRFSRTALVEHQVVERHRGLLESDRHLRERSRAASPTSKRTCDVLSRVACAGRRGDPRRPGAGRTRRSRCERCGPRVDDRLQDPLELRPQVLVLARQAQVLPEALGILVDGEAGRRRRDLEECPVSFA